MRKRQARTQVFGHAGIVVSRLSLNGTLSIRVSTSSVGADVVYYEGG